MNSRVIIACPQYYPGAGGVATFYRVFAEKQRGGATLFHVGKDRPCGVCRRLLLLAGQFLRLLFVMRRYDLLVVNPSLGCNCFFRDTVLVKIAKLFGKKTCVFWRGFNDRYFEEVVKPRYGRFLRRGLFKADHSIFLGQQIYEKYHSIGCNTPYSIFSTMLDSRFLRTEPRAEGDGTFTLLFLSRVEREKGIMEALAAFKELVAAYPAMCLVVAGTGNALPEAEEFVRFNGLRNVSFVGDVRGDSKRRCFNSADLFLFPSYFEGMPNALLEALGMGIPVVTSRVGGVPDFFADPQMGVMMEGHSAEEIVRAVKRIYLASAETRAAMSEYNRGYAESHFLDSVVVLRLESLFESIAAT